MLYPLIVNGDRYDPVEARGPHGCRDCDIYKDSCTKYGTLGCSTQPKCYELKDITGRLVVTRCEANHNLIWKKQPKTKKK
jgi:hypothetical protein